jgi:hypothetical protein
MQTTNIEQNEKLLVNKTITLKASDKYNFDFEIDYDVNKKKEPKDK